MMAIRTRPALLPPTSSSAGARRYRPGKLRELFQRLASGAPAASAARARPRGWTAVSSSVKLAAAFRARWPPRPLGGLVAFRGHHFGVGAAVAVQEHPARKASRSTPPPPSAQAGEDVLEAQAGCRVVVGCTAIRHGGHGRVLRRRVAEIALAHDELGMGERAVNQSRPEAFGGEAPARSQMARAASRWHCRAPAGHHGEGLGHGIGHAPGWHRRRDARVEQRPFSGRLAPLTMA